MDTVAYVNVTEVDYQHRHRCDAANCIVSLSVRQCYGDREGISLNNLLFIYYRLPMSHDQPLTLVDPKIEPFKVFWNDFKQFQLMFNF